MKVLSLLCLFCICCRIAAVAQNDAVSDEEYSGDENVSAYQSDQPHRLVAPADLETTRAYEREGIDVKEFDKDKWKAVVNGMNYIEEEEEEETTKDKDLNISAPSVAWGGPILKLVAYVVVGGAILAVLYFLLRNVSFDLKIQRTAIEVDDLEAPVEDIASVDTQTPLDRAIKDGNYKLAVRLYYLSLLKNLNRTGLIVWKKDKTNRDYLAELLSRTFVFDEIRKLTFSYEAVWYGDHEIRPESFESLRTRFETVLQKINNGENT